MSRLQHIWNTCSVLLALMLATGAAFGQAVPDAVYYVCAENGFKLQGPAGYQAYRWKENGSVIAGADSSSIGIPAMGAAAVGNSFITREFALQVKNAGGCWSEEGLYTVYILPRLDVTVSGYTPPYCENLPHSIPLLARINGGEGSSQLVLPPGMGVTFNWIVSQGFSSPPPVGNASIIGPTTNMTAQALTPQTSLIDNTYIIKVSYTYPANVNPATDVIGNCGGSYAQIVHADPAPEIPVINVQQF